MSDVTRSALIAISIVILSGCKNIEEAPVEGDATDKDKIYYRQISKSYVETVRFVIRNNEDVEFHGYLLDPFSDDKLELNLSGKPTIIDYEWFDLGVSESPPHRIRFTYHHKEANKVEFVIVVDSETKTPYTGQWSAVCEAE